MLSGYSEFISTIIPYICDPCQHPSLPLSLVSTDRLQLSEFFLSLFSGVLSTWNHILYSPGYVTLEQHKELTYVSVLLFIVSLGGSHNFLIPLPVARYWSCSALGLL